MCPGIMEIYGNIVEDKQFSKKDVFEKVSGKGAVLGIKGKHENIKWIVDHLYAKRKDVIDFSKLSGIDLSEYHMIVIGSPGEKSPLLERFKKYVYSGGYLVTTGGSLYNIIGVLFPGFLVWKKEKIKEGMVKCELTRMEHPLLQGTKGKGDLKFWLEPSYPINIRNPKGVNVLVSSKKLEKKYGSGALVVSFRYGEGMVVYMIPFFHPTKADEDQHYFSAALLSNLLDDAVNSAFPDPITSPTNQENMAYLSMIVLKDESKKCLACSKSFEDFKGVVHLCGGCKGLYHERCLEEQLREEGTCKYCGRLLIYEKHKDTLNAAYAPQYFAPPPSSPSEGEAGQEEKEKKPIEDRGVVYECPECGIKIKSEDTVCPGCGALFVEEDKSPGEGKKDEKVRREQALSPEEKLPEPPPPPE